MADIFKRMTIEEYKRERNIKDMTFIEGVLVNSEDDLCMACVRWYDRMIGDRFGLIHIPNGGSRNPIEAKKFKRMGVRAGVPDFLVCNDGMPIGWMEFKWAKNGLQETQQDFKKQVSQGFKWAEIRTFSDFKDTLKEWGVFTSQKESVWQQIFNNERIKNGTNEERKL